MPGKFISQKDTAGSEIIFAAGCVFFGEKFVQPLYRTRIGMLRWHFPVFFIVVYARGHFAFLMHGIALGHYRSGVHTGKKHWADPAFGPAYWAQTPPARGACGWDRSGLSGFRGCWFDRP